MEAKETFLDFGGVDSRLVVWVSTSERYTPQQQCSCCTCSLSVGLQPRVWGLRVSPRRIAGKLSILHRSTQRGVRSGSSMALLSSGAWGCSSGFRMQRVFRVYRSAFGETIAVDASRILEMSVVLVAGWLSTF